MLLPPSKNISAACSHNYSVFGDIIEIGLVLLLPSPGGIFIMCTRTAMTVFSLGILALRLGFVYATPKN